MHLISKFCPPGGTVLDFCMGTGSTAKACLLAPKHFKFFGCEADDSCLLKSMPSILEVFARQILNDESDINESEEIHEAARRYLQGKASAEDTRRKDLWRTPRGLPAVQSFPNHIVFMLPQYFDDMDLFLHGKHLPCTVWSEKWLSRLNSFDVRSLLSHECVVYGVHIKPSTIPHPQAGMGCFASQEFTEGDVIGYYYGTLVYQFMVDMVNARGVHGEGLMAVTREQFHTSAIRLATDISSSDGILHTVWMVPAKFACLRFMNDPRCLPDEVVPADETHTERRCENVKFVDIGSGRSDYTMYDAVSVRATRNIVPVEELFVDYGKDYEFK